MHSEIFSEMGASLLGVLVFLWFVFFLPNLLGKSFGEMRSESMRSLPHVGNVWVVFKTLGMGVLMLAFYISELQSLAHTQPFNGWAVFFLAAMGLIAFIQLRAGYRETFNKIPDTP